MIAVTCSLQLSHELGICNNHKHTSKLKRLDALSFHLLNRVYQPIWSSPSRLNVFICRSSVIPIRVNEIPILKTATTAVARAYNGFPGNSFVLRLLPGLVIIVFAIWGLVPLVCYGRNLFLKRSDNSWKRSGAHYVTTSYLQPLLLWTGATLVCRAFDPVVLSSEASQSVKQRLLVFVKSLSTVLAFACCLSSLIQQAQQFLLEENDSNDARDMGFQFAGKAVYSAVWVAAVSLFMELLGFSTQKLITAGGLGTVLLTLAGREIFTNFLSSMMIHATRPFVLNDWIQTKIEGYEVSGTVEHVGWWSPTIIRGDDREAVHIPNHKFTVNVVRNLSQKTHWRINTHFSISHLDVNKIHLIVADMRKVLAKSQQVEQQRLHRRVFLERINPENQALVIMVSCFVKTSRIEEYFCVKEAILLDLLRVISHHRARLATPIRTVQKMQSDEDTENIPFSDAIFTRARPDTNRPFLLIEPYRINGDDKTKAHPRSAHTNEEQVAKVNMNLLDKSKSSKAKEVPPDGKVDMQVEETGFDTETDCEIVTMSQSKFADTMVATTSTPLNSKNGSNSAALLYLNQGMSESVVANKVAATSIDLQKADSKVVATSDSKMDPGVAATSTDCGPASHISISSSDERQNSGMDNVSVAKISSCQPCVPQLKGLDLMKTSSKDTSVLGVALEKHPVTSFDSGRDEVQYVPTVTSHFKQETETMPIPPSPQARSTLEDNIILGVALEGSKRTLLIEEVVTLSPHSEEMKELAACGNANGSSSAPNDILPVPTDQRDK